MSSTRSSSSRRPIKKGGMFLPALCNIVGTLILVAVIAVSLPLAIPRMLGYEAYNVESGSMAPAIPEGSVVYVEGVLPDSLEPEEIIAFYSNGVVVTHRVIENHYFYDELVTKGDANEKEDINPVPYSQVIGRVKWHLPLLGKLLAIYSTQVTKFYLLALAFCGVMFNMLAGLLRRRAEEKFRIQVEQWEKRQASKRKAELEQIRKQHNM